MRKFLILVVLAIIAALTVVVTTGAVNAVNWNSQISSPLAVNWNS